MEGADDCGTAAGHTADGPHQPWRAGGELPNRGRRRGALEHRVHEPAGALAASASDGVLRDSASTVR